MTLDVVHEDEGEVKSICGIGEIVASGPVEHTGPEDSRVEPGAPFHGTEDPFVGRCKCSFRHTSAHTVLKPPSEFLHDTPHNTDHATHEEAVWEEGIHGEEVLDAECAIFNRRGENKDSIRAYKMRRIVPLTQRTVVKVANHPVEHADEYEAVGKHRDHLATENGAWRDLGIMRNLLVGNVVLCLRVKVLAEGRDDDEGLWVPHQPISSQKLEEHIESQTHVCIGLQKSRGNEEYGAKTNDGEQSPYRCIHRPHLQGHNAENKRNEQDHEEPPVGHLLVSTHHAGMRIILATVRRGAVANAAVHLVKGLHQRMIILDGDIKEGHGIPRKPSTLAENVGGREVGWGVGLVLGHVHAALTIENTIHVIHITSIVKGLIAVDRGIRGPIEVGVVHAENDQPRKKSSCVLLRCTEEGRDKHSGPRHIPVECGPRVVTHPTIEARHHGQVEVVWGDPRHPVERTQGRKERVWDPKVQKHGEEGEKKEPVSGQLPAIHDLASLLWNYQGAIEGNCGQHLGPDGRDGVDNKAAQQTGKAKAKELGGESKHDFISKGDPRLIEILGEFLHKIHIIHGTCG